MPETFTPKTWADGSGGGTPITAAELNRMETGLESMDDRVAAIEAVNPTANATDAALRDRATHTGTQAISTISGLQAALDAITTVTANSQTGTSYTLVLADAGRVVEMSNAAANTLTIPTAAAVAFPVGTLLEVYQGGAGQTTVAAASGVTLRAPDGARLAKQYVSATLRKRATNEWVLAGSTTT